MQQLIGSESVLYNLKVVFTDRVGKNLGYGGHQLDETRLLADQWGARKLTADPDIPLTSKVTAMNSSYILWADDINAFEVPAVASVVPFYPEFDYFLATQTGNYFTGTNTMAQNQYTMLFTEDNNNLRTLLSPINLQAFYEWYK
jgi:hypothetical protein